MRTVNNFYRIGSMINFDKSDNLFVHVQIVRRAKDHPSVKNVNERSIRTLYIRSKYELFERMPEMIALANMYGARVYINVSPKSFKTLQENMTRRMMDDIINGVVNNPEHTMKSCAGELKSKNPRWVIDIDDGADVEPVVVWLAQHGLTPAQSYDNVISDKEYAVIPTASCKHFLTPKFNSKEFEDAFPHIHIHKNSMGTLLYFNPEAAKRWPQAQNSQAKAEKL